MTLLNPGYWHTTYWAENYWNPSYWLKYGLVVTVVALIYLDGLVSINT